MKTEVLKTWTTKAGLIATCLKTDIGHLCGYIAIDKDHCFFEKSYCYHLDKKYFGELMKSEEAYKGSPIDMLIASGDKDKNVGPQISYYFNVHGGVTYAARCEKYPCEEMSGKWVFGFDCAHLDDNPFTQNEEYVTKECEKFAKRIVEFDEASK